MTSNSSPFPWGIRWRALFLGLSLSDHTKFENTMEVFSNFSSMQDMRKEAIFVVKKATSKEQETMILDLVKDDQSTNIMHWAMNRADSRYAG